MTAPGLSPIYAAARDMLAALDAGNAAGHYFDGTLCARIVDGGNYRELTLADVRRIERDTLDTWAVAVGRPDGAWAIDPNCGGRVARLEWATDGEAPAAGGSVAWIRGKS